MDLTSDWSGNLFGKYQLEKKLGNGSFGVVYKAFNVILQNYCAIKVMEFSNPRMAVKLFQEASIPHNCKHDNIISINDGEVIEYDATYYFVINMDLAEGCSVEDLMSNSFLSLNDTLSIMRNILFALEHSHMKGIIHRDIKPANILIDNGIPKLSDFGLAQALGSIVTPSRWYWTHTAPEVWLGSNIATIQTDIYAFGITLFRMVNNYSNWRDIIMGLNIQELTISGKLLSVIGYEDYVPDKIKRIIKKCCETNPLKRYKSAKDLRNDITKLNTNIEWKKNSVDTWSGKTPNGKKYMINTERAKNIYKVIIKCNGRKISSDCKSFNEISEMKQYVNNYIKNTLLQ